MSPRKARGKKPSPKSDAMLDRIMAFNEAKGGGVLIEKRSNGYLEQTTVQLYALLDKENHWAALAAIVDNLLAHETLEGEEVEDIVGQWLR